MNLVENQQSTIMKNSIQKKSFSFELENSVLKFERLRIWRFLELNKLFQNSERFFSLNGLYFQKESAIILEHIFKKCALLI
jgi:hypothetical protein